MLLRFVPVIFFLTRVWYVISRPSFAFFCRRIIHKFYRFLCVSVWNFVQAAVSILFHRSPQRFRYVCRFLSFEVFFFSGSAFMPSTQSSETHRKPNCEHGANWMIRRIGLELYHHNNTTLIAMTQTLVVCVNDSFSGAGWDLTRKILTEVISSRQVCLRICVCVCHNEKQKSHFHHALKRTVKYIFNGS